jgi:hypothetical protein
LAFKERGCTLGHKTSAFSLGKNPDGLFGWGGFGLMDLDLRVQIQILCLDDLKLLGFGFGPNPSRILKAQIHGFQMIS